VANLGMTSVKLIPSKAWFEFDLLLILKSDKKKMASITGCLFNKNE
jgi:hypothetical protein